MRSRWFPLALCGLLSACGTQAFLHVEEKPLGDRLLALLGGGGNSLVLFHGADAFVVDLKLGDFARRLRREVVLEHQHHARRILLTHSHADHAGGLDQFPDAEVVLVHPKTRARLAARGIKARWVEIEREARLVLGDEEVHVLHPGRAHTDGDLVAYLPRRRLLVSGDLLVDGYLPNADGDAGGNLLDFRRALDRLLALDFNAVLPGHGPLVPRARLEAYRDYLQALEAQVAAAQARGLAPGEAEKAVKVAGFESLRNLPLAVDREKNVRDMYRALAEEKRP